MDLLAASAPSLSPDSVAPYPTLARCVEAHRAVCARTGRPPTRADLDPVSFGSYLGRVILLEYLPAPDCAGGERIRVRLAGSKINALAEQELGGVFIDEIADDSEQRPGLSDPGGLGRRAAPALSGHTLLLRDGRTVSYERLMLPLTPLPGEPPMSVVIFLTMTMTQPNGTTRGLAQVRGPLWVNSEN